MRDLGLTINRIYASGGATKSAVWRQMLADVFETEIVRTNVAEGAAYGAAMLAGIGTKQYANAVEAADALIRVIETVGPNPDTQGTYRNMYAIYHSLYPRLTDSFAALTELVKAESMAKDRGPTD